MGHQKRLKAAEVIFTPNILEDADAGQGHHKPTGIANIAYEAIEQCDTDLRICLYNNIVLAGGTTLMKGFPERFD